MGPSKKEYRVARLNRFVTREELETFLNNTATDRWRLVSVLDHSADLLLIYESDSQ